MEASNTTMESKNKSFEGDTDHIPPGFHVESQVPLLVLAVLIVILNGTIIGLFIKKRSLRSFTNYFLVSLAVLDLLTGSLAIPLHIGCANTQKRAMCIVSNQFFVFTTLSTICHIAAITTDRYIAILKSLRYQVLVTKKRVQLVAAIIWLCCFFMTVIQMSWTVLSEKGPNEEADRSYRNKDLVYTIIFVVLGVMPIPFMVLAYCRIFVQILRQNSLTKQHNRLMKSAGVECISTRELRTVSTFVLMLLAYVFCLLPHAALRLEMNVNDNDSLDHIPTYAIYIIIYLHFFTSFLNPCFYGFGKHDFRSALRDLSKTCRQQPRKNHDSLNASVTRTSAL